MTLHAPTRPFATRRALLGLVMVSGVILVLLSACALYATHHQHRPRLRGTLAPVAWVPSAGGNEREIGR